KDLDVIIGRGGAYSTLGWFQDPVTLNLLEGSTVDLVETLIHEMTHATLYVKGQGEFNEGLAQLVGKMGAILFTKDRYGPEHPFTLEAIRTIEDERLFSHFLSSLLSDLESLYDSPLSRKEKLIRRETVFSGYRKRSREMESRLQTDRFKGFENAGLNNAYLMSIGLYHRHFLLFEAILKRHGNSIKETLLFFRNLSNKNGDILEKAKEWLDASPVNTGRLTGESPLLWPVSKQLGETFNRAGL
ncbi:MAG: aminopeptidase, partial [Bacteroidetes bacterium]|nr:aminopeptidase [Bacteroidota bacterium]